MRRILVTADDCGLSEGINLATVSLHARGMITAASLITNFPANAHALTLFSAYPSLEIGVHLNLTEGYALTSASPESGLTDLIGRFRTRISLFYRSLLPSA